MPDLSIEWGISGASEADNWLLRIARACNALQTLRPRNHVPQATKSNDLPRNTKTLRPTLNQRVPGSSPGASTTFFNRFNMLEADDNQLAGNRRADGLADYPALVASASGCRNSQIKPPAGRHPGRP
jgi:hypothetical protein